MNLIGKLFSTALVCFAGMSAMAAPQQFSTGVQNIRVGVVVLDSSGTTDVGSAAPFAFYNLSNATGVKPVSWNIYNPHAQGTVTNFTVAKYQHFASGGGLPVSGAPLTKRNSEYWFVYLDQITDTSLSDYDVLLLCPTNTARLDAYERERLTKFVDQGGILWIDPSATTGLDTTNSFPLAFMNKGGASFNASSLYANAFSPLLSSPYTLTNQDLLAVSSNYVNGSIFGFAAVPVTGTDVASSSQFNQYLGVASDAGYQTISVGHIGDGEVVVTTQGAARVLNRASGTNYAVGNANMNFTAATPVLETDGLSAAKLAVNIISQLQSYPQSGAGSRKTGSSSIDVTAPVLANWSQEPPTTGSVSSTNPPVVYKGVTVVSAGNQLMVYSSNPGSDIDKDGDPDDGIGAAGSGLNNALRDYSLGKPYDVIWTSPAMGSAISSPVCAEVPDGYKGFTDVVLVVDSTGTLYVYNLFPKNNSGSLISTAQLLYKLAPPDGSATFPNGPNAPTVSGDLAFMADSVASSGTPSGRTWVADLSAGTLLTGPNQSGTPSPWMVGGEGVSGYTGPEYTASPTVGFIPIQDGSGGYDKVVYAPGTIAAGTSAAPCFNSLWFGVKDESPTYTESGGTLTISTRLIANTVQAGVAIYDATSDGNITRAKSALGTRITFLDANNHALTPAQVGAGSMSVNQPQLGAITVPVNDGAFEGAGKIVYGVRVDYTINWGYDPDTLSAWDERGRVVFPIPPTITVNRQVLGPIALSPAGTLCMTVADPSLADGDNEGSLWWIRENKGRGGFQVTARWALYPHHVIPTSPTTSTAGPVFDDNDPLTANLAHIVPGMTGDMSRWHWAGGPVIQGGQVFATATAYKSGTIPVSVVMAFASEPPTAQFQASTFPTGFSLVQADFDKTSPAQVATPDQESTIQSANYDYDSTSGTVQLTNLAQFAGPQMTDCLSLSQPVIVRGGAGDQLFQPEGSGGTWSPLHWYCIYSGSLAQNRPVVTGNTLFFAANSIIPSILTGSQIPTYSAVIDAMDATIPTNDPYVQPSAAHSWEYQVDQVKASGSSAPNYSDPHIKMPSGSGIASFNDYKIRLVQQVLGTSTQAYGVVGGGSNLAAWGNAGVYGLSRADFIVCDQGRVLQSDSSGNITFTADASLNTGPGGGSTAGNVEPLVRPSRAYALSPTEMLVVDPGANRVVKMNNAGSEERAIDHFIVDPNNKPSGYTPNESRTLNAPADAITYSEFVSPTQSGFTPQVSNPQQEEYWVHYLIADTGNHRMLDIVDRFQVDPNTNQVGSLVTVSGPNPNYTPLAGQAIPIVNIPQTGVLVWQTPADVSGKNFAYNSITRLYLWDTSTGGGRYVYVAGIGNAQPSRTDSGLTPANDLGSGTAAIRQSATGNGGVVIFDPKTANGVQIYNNFDMPDLRNTPFWSNTAANWVNTTSANTPGQNVLLSGLNSVSAKSVIDSATGTGAIALMITVADGAYEFLVNPLTVNNTGDLGSPNWFINSAAYTELRGGGDATNPAQFHPTYAKRLGSGDILLVNSYNGILQGGLGTPFKGEVLMLNGTTPNSTANDGTYGVGKLNLGFLIQSIKFNFPTPVGVRGIVSPIFADRR